MRAVVAVAALCMALCFALSTAAPLKAAPPAKEAEAPPAASAAPAAADTKPEVAADGAGQAADAAAAPAAQAAGGAPAEPADHPAEEHHEDAEEHHDDPEDDYYDDEEEFYDDEDVDWDEYDEESEEQHKERAEEFDEEYQRYLDEMTEELMNDAELRKEIIEEIEAIGTHERVKEDKDLLELAKRLEKEHVRSKLAEQQRQTLEAQRRAARRQAEHDLEVPEHADDYDYHDMDEDLFDDPEANEARIRHIAEQRAKLIGGIDKERHHAFVQREMERELEFREQLAKATPEEKDKLLARHKAENEFLKKNKGFHPGSKAQLEHVWQKEDGFEGSNWDPKTFFSLHDVTDDGFLDIKELEALFVREARELHEYEGEVDELAVEEEVARMREHVMREADTNKDQMLSRDEFMAMTKREDFGDDERWDALIPEFTEDELKAFADRKAKMWKKAKKHLDPALAKASIRNEKELKERNGNAFDHNVVQKLQREREEMLRKRGVQLPERQAE